MEYYGHNIHANVAHGGNPERYNAKWNSKQKWVEDNFANDYHTWRMEYTDDYIKIFCDNELLNYTQLCNTVNTYADWYQYTGRNPYRDPENKQQLRLNLAIGGDNGGTPDNSRFPMDYLVDYVYVYEPDGSEFNVPDNYSHKGTGGNLIANGAFEDGNFSTRTAWVESASYTVVDGHIPYWKVAQDDWNVRVNVANERGRGNYLHIERDANHAWGDGTVSYHAKGLTVGQSYKLSALVRSQAGAPQGVRIYKCDSRGYKTYEVIKEIPIICGDSWMTWSGNFVPTSENVAIEVYMKNDWNDGGGNWWASFDMDDVTLTAAAPLVTVPVNLTNPSFDDNGAYSTEEGFINGCVTANLNGWEVFVTPETDDWGTALYPWTTSWYVAANIAQEGDRTYLHMERNSAKGDWNNFYYCVKQEIPVKAGQEYTLKFDKRSNITIWDGWYDNLNGWMPCGAIITGVTGDKNFAEVDCAGDDGGNWVTKELKFTPTGDKITLTFETRYLKDKWYGGYCDFDNVRLETQEEAVELYLMGEFNNWQAQQMYHFTESPAGVYNLDVPAMWGEFKISTPDWKWEHCYSSTMLEMVYSADPVSCVTHPESGNNMKMQYNGLNCHITFNKNDHTVKVDGDPIPALYLAGDINGFDGEGVSQSGKYTFTEDKGVYTLKLDKVHRKEFGGRFKIAYIEDKEDIWDWRWNLETAPVQFSSGDLKMQSGKTYPTYVQANDMAMSGMLKDAEITFNLITREIKVTGAEVTPEALSAGDENLLINPSFEYYNCANPLLYGPYGTNPNSEAGSAAGEYPLWYKLYMANSLNGWTAPKFNQWNQGKIEDYWGIQAGIMPYDETDFENVAQNRAAHNAASGNTFLRMWRHTDGKKDENVFTGADDKEYKTYYIEQTVNINPDFKHEFSIDARYNNPSWLDESVKAQQGHGVQILDGNSNEVLAEINNPGQQVDLTSYNNTPDVAVAPDNKWETKSVIVKPKSDKLKVRLWMNSASMHKNWMGFADFDNAKLVRLNVPTGIDNVDYDAADVEITGVYTLSGVKVAESTENLAPGFYVVVTTAGAYKIAK